ncbi:MAG: hypothetical protein U7126_10960 [Microcoleus sp.]
MAAAQVPQPCQNTHTCNLNELGAAVNNPAPIGLPIRCRQEIRQVDQSKWFAHYV